MKKYAFTLLMAMCAYTNLASASNILSADDRVYLSSKDIIVGDNGIFVHLDGDVVQVQSLSTDEQGLYTLAPHIERAMRWYCKACDKHTWSFNDKCPTCGKQKPKCGQ